MEVVFPKNYKNIFTVRQAEDAQRIIEDFDDPAETSNLSEYAWALYENIKHYHADQLYELGEFEDIISKKATVGITPKERQLPFADTDIEVLISCAVKFSDGLLILETPIENLDADYLYDGEKEQLKDLCDKNGLDGMPYMKAEFFTRKETATETPSEYGKFTEDGYTI